MNDKVRAKKNLGQHFLKDESIAEKIAGSLEITSGSENVLEIGPGMGVLTNYLLQNKHLRLKVIEIDEESVKYLESHLPELKGSIQKGDFLHSKPGDFFSEEFSIIGNFPYNISSQILFYALENRSQIKNIVGMFQKEVAVRITSGPGNRDYGILSVLLQAFYSCEYLFTVDEVVFDPPPKVKSGVIRLIRKENFELGCDEKIFKEVVKAGFNQRRKTLRNALGGISGRAGLVAAELPYSDKRAEQLSWEKFRELTLLFQGKITPSQSGQ